MRNILFLSAVFVLMGAGCVNPLAKTEVPATDINFSVGASFVFEDTVVGFSNPFAKAPTTTVTLTTWKNDDVGIAWTRVVEEETAASIAAREQASSAPVGSDVEVPDPEYAEVTLTGTLVGDGRLSGTTFYPPVGWQTGDQDVSSGDNALAWLSQEVYAELVETRHATVTVGSVDDLLAELAQYYVQAKDMVAGLRGESASSETQEDILSSLVTLTAEADWGSYDVVYNNEKITVPTVIAENAFARYVILANPENPLVLSFTPRPAAWMTAALEMLRPGVVLTGYQITQISLPNADQLLRADQ